MPEANIQADSCSSVQKVCQECLLQIFCPKARSRPARNDCQRKEQHASALSTHAPADNQQTPTKRTNHTTATQHHNTSAQTAWQPSPRTVNHHHHASTHRQHQSMCKQIANPAIDVAQKGVDDVCVRRSFCAPPQCTPQGSNENASGGRQSTCLVMTSTAQCVVSLAARRQGVSQRARAHAEQKWRCCSSLVPGAIKVATGVP